MQVTFLGAAGTVTGSKYLLAHGGKQVLADCGLFQGLKQLRLKNWAPFPLPARNLDAVVLTHAHIDHSGYLPALVRQGFRGPVYCTRATADLCGIMLPDAGHLQEEDAAYANRHGFSRHQPALPLYTEADARRSLQLLQPRDFGESFDVVPGIQARFSLAGHIRVVHHLKAMAPDHRNTILLAGYQAAGTRGAALAAGAREIKIHGEYVPVRAEVASIGSLSAHADREELLAWIGQVPRPPRRVFITHGEPVPADHLRLKIEEAHGFEVTVAEHQQAVDL